MSSRQVVVLLLVMAFPGCLDLGAVLSPSPEVTIENRANVTYQVSATVVPTDDPVTTIPLELTYQNGSSVTTRFGEYASGNDFFVPSNVTAISVTSSTSESWSTTLAPGQNDTTQLTEWQSNDIVLITYTRRDDSVVTKVTTIPCRNAGVEYDGHVTSADGSGGAGTTC